MKIEGGVSRVDTITKLVDSGIAVMGHIGMIIIIISSPLLSFFPPQHHHYHYHHCHHHHHIITASSSSSSSSSGLTPQGISVLGGFRAQGRTAMKAKAIVDDAIAIEKAGAFAIVIECKLIHDFNKCSV